MIINTGDERSVTGHLISGTISSGIIAGSINYSRYKKADITQKEFLGETAKVALQGGIGTASAVATANYIGKGDYLGALSAIGVGALGVYATEKFYSSINYNMEIKYEQE